ncbi:hypothetical protein CORC01_11733 [Colletotrichum orchidophilum]|uniref:Uncharacterized protein n=1 Tax=Colletotrichum orchidophilum TaxID=1209926 RepID=A0A1G4AUU0_9PEZI|nr:uncharacterized protein CORC01_11733 [Colletotrichum orchidophilum]OHE92940.1 hypothetical protein CORC01_11733 [Colletotrichum orchidophilum]
MCSYAGADWLGRLEQTRHWSEDECVCEDDKDKKGEREDELGKTKGRERGTDCKDTVDGGRGYGREAMMLGRWRRS